MSDTVEVHEIWIATWDGPELVRAIPVPHSTEFGQKYTTLKGTPVYTYFPTKEQALKYLIEGEIRSIESSKRRLEKLQKMVDKP